MTVGFTPPGRIFHSIIGLFLTTQLICGLTNSDVVTLHEAGIGADTIVLAINNAEDPDFDLTTASLVELKEAGVDDKVIQAILLAGGGSQAEQTAEPAIGESAMAKSRAEQPSGEDLHLEIEDKPETRPLENPASMEELLNQPEQKLPQPKKEKTPPEPVYRPVPDFPKELKEKGISGSVRLKFTVNSEGSVKDITAINSDHPLFTAAAMTALSKWRFNPGLEDGEPVDSEVKLTIPFNVSRKLSPLNRPPRTVSNPTPNYPRTLREQGITGFVQVQFIVDGSGEVQDIQVLSSDHELFTEEALKVLKKWKFTPAIRNGQPIASRVQFSIPFKIRD